MDTFFLSLIQGVTEFMPVSSNLHLKLFEHFTHPMPKYLNVFLHLGTLCSVLIYFFSDLCQMTKNVFGFNTQSSDWKLAWSLVLATLPTIVVGYVIHRLNISAMFSLKAMGIVSIICGSLLLLIDSIRPQTLTIPSYVQALYIGFIQSVAFIPGASRLGMCLTGTRLIGMSRIFAVRFSFLLSIPSVLGAVILESQFNPGWIGVALITGAIGYGTMIFMMSYLEKCPLWPLMIYRIILGIAMVLWF